MHTVVCPLTGDTNAERALASAYDAACILKARIELCSVVEDRHMVGRREEYLDRIGAKSRASGASMPGVHVVVDPHAPRALAARAASPDVQMVMATSAQPLMHTGYLGSAAERVLRTSHHPVILLGPHNQTRLSDAKKVVIPCDGSSLSEEIIPDAVQWAQRMHAELWVVTVLDPHAKRPAGAQPEAESNYVRRIGQGVGANWEVLHGHDPARTITDWAGPDALIALTSHGRSGFSRMTVGSVASAIARWALGPVLVGNQQKQLVEPQK